MLNDWRVFPIVGVLLLIMTYALKLIVMSQRYVISDHVIETIKALPAEEREAVSRALALELFAGGDPESVLTPFQAMLYSVIRYHVKRDSDRGMTVDIGLGSGRVPASC